MSQYTFTLSGADGEQHEYVGTPIPPAAGGTALALQIYALSGGALGNLFKGLLDSLGGLGGLIELVGDKEKLKNLDVDELLGKLNLSELGAALASSLGSLQPRVLHDLLAHTSRDGKPLKQEAHINAAYVGNYLEMMTAAALVANHNGFFTSGRTFSKTAQKPSDASETPTDALPA